jgi:Golgi nucleoside diphosphatase
MADLMPRILYLATFLVFIILYVFVYVQTLTPTNTHTFVIDAGSSGTRIHLYHDQTTNIIQSFNTRPGISALTPKEAAKQIIELFRKFQIPLTKNELYLLATAGMRTLSKQNQTDIYEEIRTELQEDPILGNILIRKMETISGQEEGKLAWVAANWLQNTIFSSTTYGIADLGKRK